MDYKEKYEKALATARKLYNEAKANEYLTDMEDYETIFPELKESEDERIRKDILRYVRTMIGDKPDLKIEGWIDWLEKQGGINKLSEEEQNRFAKGVLTSCALSFINFLDAHKYEGKMCVSNGECEDIENAFHNAMWDRLHRYYCKYIEKQSEKDKPTYSTYSKDVQLTQEEYDKRRVSDEATIKEVEAYKKGLEDAQKIFEKQAEKKYDCNEEDEKIRKRLICFLDNLLDQGGMMSEGWDSKECEAYIDWLEKQNGQKLTIPKWKYKKDNTPLLRDSIILNKYGCVAKAPSGAIISDAWVLDYDELAKLPKEELEKQGETKTELATEEEIYWLAWVIGKLPDTEIANEAEAVLKELLEKIKNMKGCE